MIQVKLSQAVTINTLSDGRLAIFIPFEVKRHNAQRKIYLPDGSEANGQTAPATALQQALARAHHWQQQIARGEINTIAEIAKREQLNDSYVSRIFRLINLSPDVVAAILDGNLPDKVTLFELTVNQPMLWEEQVKRYLNDNSI